MAGVHVFFFRGLSTYGADRAKWSVFDFGPIYKHLERAFRGREVMFHPVLGMGAGTLLEVAERAQTFLDQHPVWRDRSTPVHLFGHSAGGLIARRVAAQSPRGKILSCLTAATPNQGTTLAELCVEMPKRYPGSTWALRSMGYDVGRRKNFFKELTPQSVKSLMRDTKEGEMRLASVVCSAPRAEWCVPLKALYKLRAFADLDLPSDGIVERDSQPFGEVIAELTIDHVRQVGLFGEPQRFQQMCEVLTSFFAETQRIS